MGDDQPFALEFCSVCHQWPVIEVILHLLFKETAFADEEVGAIGDLSQGVGPFGVPGLGDDLSCTFDPQRIGGSATSVDHPERKDGKTFHLLVITFGHLHILDCKFPLDPG